MTGAAMAKGRQRGARNEGGTNPAGRLEKTIYTSEYAVVLDLLREARERAGVTQVELAQRLGQTQSFVSKVERGDRRLDVVQLRTILRHFDVSLGEFVKLLEQRLANG